MGNFALKSYHLQENPCKQDCPNRTATCKFDGTCEKWSNHQVTKEKKREEYYHERGNRRNLMRGLSGGRR